MDIKWITGLIIAILVVSGVAITWEFSKDWSTLKRDGVILAKHKWVMNAERTFVNKPSSKCNKILAMGGYETATRCYYPDDYYEQMSRSLIKTKLDTQELQVTRDTPYYMYGTNGAYAGWLKELFIFDEKSTENEFPKDYVITWEPKDTRKYRAVWRVESLKDQPLPDGIYADCRYTARNVIINLGTACSQLDYAVVKNDKIHFYFIPQKGDQEIRLFYEGEGGGVVDPITEYSGLDIADDSYVELRETKTTFPIAWTNTATITIATGHSTVYSCATDGADTLFTVSKYGYLDKINLTTGTNIQRVSGISRYTYIGRDATSGMLITQDATTGIELFNADLSLNQSLSCTGMDASGSMASFDMIGGNPYDGLSWSMSSGNTLYYFNWSDDGNHDCGSYAVTPSISASGQGGGNPQFAEDGEPWFLGLSASGTLVQYFNWTSANTYASLGVTTVGPSTYYCPVNRNKFVAGTGQTATIYEYIQPPDVVEPSRVELHEP